MSAEIADNAGMPQLRQFLMVSIKELLVLTRQSCNTRERALGSLPANRAFNSDQVISGASATAPVQRAPGPGLKLKPQASSVKLSNQPVQASSDKRQAPEQQASSVKPQAASSLILEPWNMDIGEVLGGKGPRVFAMINVLCG
jgi:hypothetical protein